MRKRGAVYPLGAEDINVVLLHELIWREGFGRAEHHMAGIVDECVEATCLRQHSGDAGLG